MKKSYQIGSGRVYYRTIKTKSEDGKLTIVEMPVFRGKPEVHARLMMRAHTPAGALAIIDKLVSTDIFWINARNYILNRIEEAGQKKASK